MKLAAAALILALVPASARADKNETKDDAPAPTTETRVVADKALAKMVFNNTQTCAAAARMQAAFDQHYGALDAQNSSWETLRDMSDELRALTPVRDACRTGSAAVRARLDLLLGKGTSDRVQSMTVFEGKVSVVLRIPTPPAPAPRGDAEEYHGGGCP